VDALGSAINIVPQIENGTTGQLSYETGSFNTHIATINANIELSKHFSVGTNTFYNYSDNDFKVDNLRVQNPKTGQVDYVRAKLFHNRYNQLSMEYYLRAMDFSWADQLELRI